MKDFKICHKCGGKMFPTVGDKTIIVKGKPYHFHNIKTYDCSVCGVSAYPDSTVKKIEEYVKEVNHGV